MQESRSGWGSYFSLRPDEDSSCRSRSIPSLPDGKGVDMVSLSQTLLHCPVLEHWVLAVPRHAGPSVPSLGLI